MHDDDVSPADMTHHDFTDDAAEAMLSGITSGDPQLGDTLGDIRSAFEAIDPPVVTGALGEFVGAGTSSFEGTGTDLPRVVALNVEPESPRRHPVFKSVSAFAGTAIGKICIGASVAAASVGGATATGVIDTPFDNDSVVETEFVEDEALEIDDSADVNDDDSTDDDTVASDSDDDSAPTTTVRQRL